MNKNDILKKIGIIINELQEQYIYSEENADDINDLELELFVANAHFLTDHLEILRKLYNKQVNPLRQELLPPAPEVKPEPAVQPMQETRYFEPVAQPIIKKEPEPVEQQIPELLLPEETENSESEIIQKPEHEEAQQELPYIEEELIIPIIRHQLIYDEPASELPEEEERHDDLEEGEEEEWIAQELSETEFKPEEEIAEPEPITEEAFEKAKHVMEDPEYAEEQIHEEPQYYTEPEEITSEAEEEITPEPEPVITEPVYEPKPEMVEAESTIEEENTTEKALTLNEILAAQRIAETPQLPPVKDIKSAINLNDKLLYVRDLFNGYSMAYGEAIEILNRFNKFEEADQFLRINYYNKNNWEAKQDTADKFYTLLRRRFPD